MKINIWIRKEEAVSGKISKFYNTAPQLTSWPDYFQVTVSQEEFAKLVGMKKNDSMSLTSSGRSEENYTYPQFVEKHYKKETKSDWLVEQYNRNRVEKDWVTSREEIPYIYEKNPDSGQVYRRKSGDKHENREKVSVGVGERDYSGEKALEQLMDEMKDKTGEEFLTWFHKLTKNEQTKLAAYYND